MTNIENPLAYSYFMQDDIFLLESDKQALKTAIRPAVTMPVPVVETSEISFQYRGSNKLNYLIVTHYPNEDFMADAHFAALAATLKRLHVEPDDAALFNLAKHAETQFEHITGFFNPKKMLVLGSKAMPAGMQSVRQNKPQAIGGVYTLFTFSFAEMMDNTENKKAFWEAIKSF